MRIRFAVMTTLLLSVLTLSTSAAQAVDVPANPGDFIVAMQPGGPAEGEMPKCDPDLTTIGSLFMSGQTSVTATCTMTSTSSAATITGTASNPTLGASTGDAGFANGTITAQCTSSQSVNLQLSITMAGSSMNTFSGKVFQACTFVMQFADSASSQLLGTIELNGRLGSDDGTVVNNTITIAIDAKVFVTSGTGAFAGYAGSGTFSQTQEINVDPNNQGGRSDSTITQPAAVTDFCTSKGISPCTAQTVGAWCLQNQGPQAADCQAIMSQVKTASAMSVASAVTDDVRSATVWSAAVAAAAAGDNNSMSLTLAKSAGRARILSPAPAAGSPTAAAKVKSTTKVKVTAPAGSTCTVKANTGKIVGVGKVSGRYSTVSISPRAGSYKKATSIVSTCKTKKGKVLTSNRVKIKL